MFAKNRVTISIRSVSQILFFSGYQVCTHLSEADMLDLSLEDDDYMHRDMYLWEFGLPVTIVAGETWRQRIATYLSMPMMPRYRGHSLYTGIKLQIYVTQLGTEYTYYTPCTPYRRLSRIYNPKWRYTRYTLYARIFEPPNILRLPMHSHRPPS